MPHDLARAAIDAGATAGTHVFNAMRQLHHREPGPALALLEDPAVFAEVIADGVHLHPALSASLPASPARAVFVTDAMAAAGVQEGRYPWARMDVVARRGPPADGTIAGSILTLDAAVRHAVNDAGIPLPTAVRAASQYPADMLGLSASAALEPGARADVTLLSAELRPAGVLFRGPWARSLPGGGGRAPR